MRRGFLRFEKIEFVARQMCDRLSLRISGSPDGAAPMVDGLIPRWSGLCAKNAGDGAGRVFIDRRDVAPLLALSGDAHVGELDLATGETFFEVTVQADEGEDGLMTWLFDRCAGRRRRLPRFGAERTDRAG